MAVTVQYDDIAARWSLPEYDRAIWLELVGASDASSLAPIAAALERTNAVANARWTDDSGMFPWATSPSLAPGGTVWRLECEVDEGPRGWLSELAEQLSAVGVTGEIRTYRVPEVGLFSTLADGHPGASAAVILSLSGWEPGPMRFITSPWQAHPEMVPELVELALEFLVDDRPASLQMDNGALVDVTRTTIRDLLPLALAMPWMDVPIVWIRQTGGDVNRQISFDPFGRVLLNVVTDPHRLVEQMQRPMSLARSWASSCDWIVLLENALGAIFDEAYHHARAARLPRAFGRGRARDTDPLPDAFPWAIVTPTQLPPTLDLERWAVTPITDERLQVESRTLNDWLTMARPTKTTTPETLTLARQDWRAIT